MWFIGGFIEIERLTDRVNDFMRLPFQFQIPGQTQPTFQQIQEMAINFAQEWLGMLQDTAPGHRADYGQPSTVELTFTDFRF